MTEVFGESSSWLVDDCLFTVSPYGGEGDRGGEREKRGRE